MVSRERPSLTLIEGMIRDSCESIYPEGITGFGRSEAVIYHMEAIAKKYRELGFLVFKDRSGKADGLAVYRKLDWDSRYLKRSVSRIDLMITRRSATFSLRRRVYSAFFNELESIFRSDGTDVAYFRADKRDKALNNAAKAACGGPLSVLMNMERRTGLKTAEKKIDPGIFIRRTKPEDADRIMGLMASGYRNRLIHEKMFKKGRVISLYRAWISNDIKGRVEYCLVAGIGKKIDGFIAFDELSAGKKRFAFIDMIVVDAARRKAGLGTLLMRGAIEVMKKRSPVVFLGVERDKTSVVDFYLRFGFREAVSYSTYHMRVKHA